MKINAKVLESNYYKWLKEDLVFSDVDENYVAISTPFVDNSYDNINLYAEIENQKIRVTDLGFTLFNLDIAGVTINKRTKTRQAILQDVLDMFGVENLNGVLSITTSLNKFAIAKNRLLQAIMRINDIEYLANNNVTNAFNEMVSEFLENNDVLYSEKIEIPGTAGVSSFFDFVIPTKKSGEKLVKAVSRPNELNQAKAFNFDVQSVSIVRPNSKFIYLVDDVRTPTKINPSIITTVSANIEKDIVTFAPYSTVISHKNNILTNQ